MSYGRGLLAWILQASKHTLWLLLVGAISSSAVENLWPDAGCGTPNA